MSTTKNSPNEKKRPASGSIFGLWATLAITAVAISLGSLGPLLFGVWLYVLRMVSADLSTPGTSVGDGLTEALSTMGAHEYFFTASVVLTALVSTWVVWAFIRWRGALAAVDYLAIYRVGGRTVLVWCIAIVALSLLGDGFLVWIEQQAIPDFVLSVYHNNTIAALVVAIVIAAPLWEELVFRGFLFRGIERSALGGGGAIVISALIWTVIHVQYAWPYLVVLFFLGLLLGVARMWSGSVVLPIFMHATVNACVIVQLAFLGR